MFANFFEIQQARLEESARVKTLVTVIAMRLVWSAIDCGASGWVVVAGLGLGVDDDGLHDLRIPTELSSKSSTRVSY